MVTFQEISGRQMAPIEPGPAGSKATTAGILLLAGIWTVVTHIKLWDSTIAARWAINFQMKFATLYKMVVLKKENSLGQGGGKVCDFILA